MSNSSLDQPKILGDPEQILQRKRQPLKYSNNSGIFWCKDTDSERKMTQDLKIRPPTRDRKGAGNDKKKKGIKTRLEDEKQKETTSLGLTRSL